MRDSSRGRYCSHHRYLMDRYGTTNEPHFARACDYCGADFVTSRSRARFCRTECRRAREREDRISHNASRSRVWVGRCGVCGSAFVSPTADGPHVRMCSDQCRAEAKRTSSRIKERTRDEPRPPRRSSSATSGSARSPKSAPAPEVFTRSEIAERDGWVCQLCGLPVDASLEWPNPMSLSLYRKVPFSAGGSHSRDNCLLTHLKCNLAESEGVA